MTNHNPHSFLEARLQNLAGHFENSFEHFATGIVFKWLNRRSQRRSYNWQGFRQALIRYGLGEKNIEKIAA